MIAVTKIAVKHLPSAQYHSVTAIIMTMIVGSHDDCNDKDQVMMIAVTKIASGVIAVRQGLSSQYQSVTEYPLFLL